MNSRTEEISHRIYTRANVLLEEGSSFDEEGGTYFQRICLSTRRDLIEEAFQRIADAFSDL